MASPQARKPDRFTGLPSGVSVGPLGRRFVAYLVDSIVPWVIALITFVVPALRGHTPSAGTGVVGAVLIVLWELVVWGLLATRAAGPGMLATKLQLVGFTDGRPIGWGRVLVRGVVLGLLSATGLGLLLMVILLMRHPRFQGWHDLTANAVVIRARMLAPRARPSSTASAAAALPVTATASPAPSPADAVAPEATPAELAPADLAPADLAPGGVAPVEAAPVDAAETWVAVLDDGREVAVRGLVLFGRNPQPRPGEEGAELVRLADDSRTVSKSHLSLDVDERGLFVVDRDSTNGSTLTTPQGEAFRCVPGQPTYLGEGSVISVGDHRLRVHLVAGDRQGEGSRPR